ncbi:MAG: hypothetical protein M3R41_08530 [Pseudomonadota bacterium]|nr:hypothetical protein [Pseudomonadota bacterium]
MKPVSDLIKKKPAQAAQHRERRFPSTPSQPVDVEHTERLRALFSVPPAARDRAWRNEFWDAVWTAALRVADPLIFVAADGFAYLRLNVPAAGTHGANSLANVAASMVGQGGGVAVFA